MTQGYVWHCRRCGRYIGTVYSLDGELVVRHKCGALNRLRAVLSDLTEPGEGDVEPEQEAREAFARLHLEGNDQGPGTLAVLPFGALAVVYPVDVPAARWLGEHTGPDRTMWGVGTVVGAEIP